jgi:hypothetical protein
VVPELFSRGRHYGDCDRLTLLVLTLTAYFF